MKEGKSYGLLIVAMGLLMAAGFLGWKGLDPGEAGEVNEAASQIGSGPPGGRLGVRGRSVALIQDGGVKRLRRRL